MDDRDQLSWIAVLEPGVDAWLHARLFGDAEQAAWFFNNDDITVFVVNAQRPFMGERPCRQFDGGAGRDYHVRS